MVDVSWFSRQIKAFEKDASIEEVSLRRMDRLKEKRRFISEDAYRREETTIRDTFAHESSALGVERQGLIEKSHVVVIGSGHLSQLIASGLAGLGFGPLTLFDNDRVDHRPDILTGPALTRYGQSKVTLIVDELRKINPHAIRYEWYHSPFEECFLGHRTPDLIIDATNNPESKGAAFLYAAKHRLPMISGSTDRYRGMLSLSQPDEPVGLEAILHSELSLRTQGVASSGIIGGLVLEEVRRSLFRYSENDIPQKTGSVTRIDVRDLNLSGEPRGEYKLDYKKNRALVIGGGAIGNVVSLELALLGFDTIGVVDMDTTQPHNVTRQILLRYRDVLGDNIGKPKTDLIASRLADINPACRVVSFPMRAGQLDERDAWIEDEEMRSHYRLTKEDIRLGVRLFPKSLFWQYDVIFGCVDNKYARLWANHAAVSAGKAYIDGGTHKFQGQVLAYQPGVTPCVDCQADLMSFPDQNPCSYEPSTVIPNMIIGSYMVAAAEAYLSRDVPPLTRELKYEPFLPKRFWTARTNKRGEHSCYRR